MKKVFAVLAMLCHFACSGAEDRMWSVRNDYEAGRYEEAKATLEEMQKEAKESWKRKALAYNIGTVDLALGNNGQALNLLRAIAPKADSYLEDKVVMNASVALWREVQELLPITSFSSMQEAVFHLKGILDIIQTIDPKTYPNSVVLRESVKPLLADLLGERLRVWKQQEKVREKILGLLIGLDRVQEQVNFLEKDQQETSLQEKYISLYHQQQESWIPLWDSLIEQGASIEQAKQFFDKGVTLFAQGAFEKSNKAFKQATNQLKKQLQNIWGEEMVGDLLAPIFGKYTRALEQETLTPFPFRNLLREQNLLTGVIPEITESNQYLEEGIRSISQGEVVEGRVYLVSARQVINRLLRNSNEKKPEELLESVIEEQHHALNIGNMVWLSDKQKLRELPVQAQNQTLITARPYLEKVFAWQNTLYPEECQCQPWDKVLPLFEKGRDAAEKAERLYREGFDKVPIALAFEKKALDYWKKALEAFHEPQKQQRKPQDQESEKNQEETPAVAIEEVLRLLQKMEQDDRQPSPQAIPEKGMKPW